MALQKLNIDLDSLAEKAFELTKIKENYDLKERIHALRLGIFKTRLREIMKMIKLIFETYDGMINSFDATSGNILVLEYLKRIKQAIAGDGKPSSGLKKFVGSFLYRKEITDAKINEVAISQFLVIITNLIAKEIRDVKGLNFAVISDEYKLYTDIESIKKEILEYAIQRLS